LLDSLLQEIYLAIIWVINLALLAHAG